MNKHVLKSLKIITKYIDKNYTDDVKLMYNRLIHSIKSVNDKIVKNITQFIRSKRGKTKFNKFYQLILFFKSKFVSHSNTLL